jgi:hypothetical protein
MSIVFTTAWYHFKAKFDASIYEKWMDNFLSNVHNFYLVIYTDDFSSQLLQKYMENPRIRIVLLPYTEFHNYRYKDNWIQNHDKNLELRYSTDWKVNMLWCEKIFFVQRTIQQQYFVGDIDMYGWCDIGYFRGNNDDTSVELLASWPSSDKICALDKTKIHYALVNRDPNFLGYLEYCILNKNEKGLPINPIPPNQTSIAGGFFICHKDCITGWAQTFDNRVKLYFENGYLIKDDQMIIVDCYYTNKEPFYLHTENTNMNNWFMFQRILL